jgi:hypothetical protein
MRRPVRWMAVPAADAKRTRHRQIQNHTIIMRLLVPIVAATKCRGGSRRRLDGHDFALGPAII